MEENLNNNLEPQTNNLGNANQNPINNLSAGKAAKGCFGLSSTVMIAIIVLLGLGMWGCNSYNGFVEQDQKVEKAWSQVENQYQRRIDLYKNVAATVKAYAKHERETYQGVTNARAGVNKQQEADQQMQAIENTADSLAQVKKTLDPTDSEAVKKYEAAQNKLKDQMSIAINVVHEAYPDLKANENFKELQAQIEGTENRVTTARMDFIEQAREYNTMIKRFPANIMANIFGFKEKAYFAAQEGADKAPDVNSMLED